MADIDIRKDMPDDMWHETILRSITDSSLGLPGFPSQTVQEIFVGRSNQAAMQEAFDFYKYVKNAASLTPSVKVLDFGVGWGRIIRYFNKDVHPDRLFGVDVDPAILDECNRLNIPGELKLIEPGSALPFADGTFDIVYSFSVFSHLSTEAARHALSELMRVLRPEGTLVFTTTSDRFLNLCLACRLKTSDRNQYEKIYAEIFADPQAALDAYHRGDHVYAAIGGNSASLKAENYGWAAMPEPFVRKEMSAVASDINFSDDPAVCEQAIFTLKKRSSNFKTRLREIFKK